MRRYPRPALHPIGTVIALHPIGTVIAPPLPLDSTSRLPTAWRAVRLIPVCPAVSPAYCAAPAVPLAAPIWDRVAGTSSVCPRGGCSLNTRVTRWAVVTLNTPASDALRLCVTRPFGASRPSPALRCGASRPSPALRLLPAVCANGCAPVSRVPRAYLSDPHPAPLLPLPAGPCASTKAPPPWCRSTVPVHCAGPPPSCRSTVSAVL